LEQQLKAMEQQKEMHLEQFEKLGTHKSGFESLHKKQIELFDT
jgi:hypothetical protein